MFVSETLTQRSEDALLYLENKIIWNVYNLSNNNKNYYEKRQEDRQLYDIQCTS